MLSNFNLSYPSVKTSVLSHSEKIHTLTVEPLLPGFGHTLGNSLRRVLLSSIPGYAITKIRINNVTHEYQTIPGVVEDVMDIVLNLKSVRFALSAGEEKATVFLTKSGPGEVLANDFEKNANAKIINPDTYICTLDKDAKIEIEIEITQGFGYFSIEQVNQSDASSPQDILVDALFSPVVNVALNVTQVRVNEKTNYEKIEMEIETDGTVDINEIVNYGLKLCVDLFSNIQSSFLAGSQAVAVIESVSKPEVAISEDLGLDLSKKVKGILEKNGIVTKEDLIARKDEIADLAGISEKAVKEVQDYLNTL